MKDYVTDRMFRLAAGALIVWYCGLCLMHYVSQRPLWNDELAVFESMWWYQPHELFSHPLRTFQVFPHLYLFCIRMFAKPFDYSVLSLRFFSFLFMISAFFVWIRVARNALKSHLERLTFLLCWVGSVPLIYYSAELKQYSLDVCLSGLWILMFSYWPELTRGSQWKLTAVLVLFPSMVLFSYPSYFFLGPLFWNLFLWVREDWGRRKFLVLCLLSTAFFVVLSYQFDVRLREIDILDYGFKDYFISTNSPVEFLKSFGEGINNLFSRWFAELPKIFRKLARLFMIFGFTYLFIGFFKEMKKRSQSYLTSVPGISLVIFGELVLAGILQKYPFGVPRTALFLCPLLLILTIQGMSALKPVNKYVYYVIKGTFVLYLIVTAVGITRIVLTQPLTSIPTLWSS